LPIADEEKAELRKEILQYRNFKEAPKILIVNLNSGNIQQARNAYDLMEQRIRELTYVTK
jgi:predicted Fe-Mo cluster-binding NifX family protein